MSTRLIMSAAGNVSELELAEDVAPEQLAGAMVTVNAKLPGYEGVHKVFVNFDKLDWWSLAEDEDKTAPRAPYRIH